VVGYKALKPGEAVAPPTAEKEVYNVALVQLGGGGSLAEAAARSRAVIKSSRAGIDFLRDPRGLSFLGLDTLSNDEVQYPLRPVECLSVPDDPDTLEIDDDGIFTLGGVTFGLEICLDHKKSKLRNTKPKEGENRMQVQLVPSAGVQVREAAVCVQPGGWVFHCEGLFDSSHNAGGAHSTAWQSSTRVQRLRALAQVDAFGASWQEDLQDLYMTDQVEPPRVSVYPAVDLPPPERN